MTPLCLISLLSVIAAPDAATPCEREVERGETLVDAGDYGQAETVLNAAIELCKEDPTYKSTRPFVALGKVLYSQERFGEAAPFFKQALGLKPTHETAAAYLCASLAATDSNDEAIKFGKKALHAKDKKVRFLANLCLGRALVQRAAEPRAAKDKRGKKKEDKLEKADKYLKAASKLNPDQGDSYYFLALLAAQSGADAGEVKEAFEKACEKGSKPACKRAEP